MIYMLLVYSVRDKLITHNDIQDKTFLPAHMASICVQEKFLFFSSWTTNFWLVFSPQQRQFLLSVKFGMTATSSAAQRDAELADH